MCSKIQSSERKCSNAEECQEQAERLAQKEAEEAKANTIPLFTTKTGAKYRDAENGYGEQMAEDNDDETIMRWC